MYTTSPCGSNGGAKPVYKIGISINKIGEISFKNLLCMLEDLKTAQKNDELFLSRFGDSEEQ